MNDQIGFEKHAVRLLMVDFVRDWVKDHVSTVRLLWNHCRARHVLVRQLMEVTRHFLLFLVWRDLW